MTRHPCVGATLVFVGVLGVPLAVRSTTGTPPVQSIASPPTARYVPDDLRDTGWLQRLGAAQVKAVSRVAAFHDFRFTDCVVASGQ